MQLQMLAPVLGVVGFVIALVIYNVIKSAPVGNEKMHEIADAIHGGAMAFLKREYSVLAIFIVLVFFLISLAPSLGFSTALAFLGGALCSMLCGFIGMKAATHANVRTSEAARSKGQGGGPDGLLQRRRRHGPGGRFSRPDRRRHCLHHLRQRSADGQSTSTASPWAPPPSPCLPASAAASTPRPPTSVPTWSARSRPASPKTTRATPASSPTTSVTASATPPAWAPISSNPTSARSSPPSPLPPPPSRR